MMGKSSKGRPARNFIDELIDDNTRIRNENVGRTMYDRNGWKETVRNFHEMDFF